MTDFDRTVTSGLEERRIRIEILMERGMTQRAATLVVNAAMYGEGCLDKRFADQQGAEHAKD